MKFTNPILSGSHPDPSICAVGKDYYLISSTFEYFPGVPVFHSKDLIHWKRLGCILNRKDQLNLDKIRSSGGIYAPTLRYHQGRFYMITTLVDGGGNFFVSADNPEGPWSDPLWINAEGFDPSLFFDEDGKVYYTQQSEGRFGHISQAEIDIKTGKLKGTLSNIWEGTGGIWPEGPHLYKKGDFYYLLIAEGGTSFDHCITVARSKFPNGPFESCPGNPLMTHRESPDHPIQALGHADLVETADGWWSVLLGFRKDNRHLGRETFLTPVEWNEMGWPVFNKGKFLELEMDAPLLPAQVWEKGDSPEFSGSPLGSQYHYIRNPQLENYSLEERSGYLRLYGSPVSLSDQNSPTFIGRRQTEPSCSMETLLEYHPQKEGEEAGIVIRADDRNYLVSGICKKEGRRQYFFRKTIEGKILEERFGPLGDEKHQRLCIEAEPRGYKFFIISAEKGQKTITGESEATGFVYEKIGNFMGVFVGLYARAGLDAGKTPADFQYLKVERV